ncbi:MAG: hypothetical protein ACT7A5_16080 [Ferrovibrionaceae bacterium]
MIDQTTNAMWLHPDWVQENDVLFSGGNWSSSAGLIQLRNSYLSLRARSIDAETSSTVIDWDLGELCSIRAVIGLGHNLSRSARRRISLYSDAARTVLVAQAPWEDVIPVIYSFGSLPYEHPSWFDGRIEPRLLRRYPMPIKAIWPSHQLARYGRLEIDDTANSDGYVELGRLIIAYGLQPTRGVSVPNDLNWMDELSRVTVTAGGALNVIERPRYREASVTIENLPEDEVLSTLFDMGNSLGKTRSFYFMLAPKDTVHFHRKSGLFRFEQPPRHSQRRRLRRDMISKMIEVTA